MTQTLPHVTIYADGACVPNPGSGGVGIVLLFGEHARELSKPVGKTTNQGAEILSAIEALKALNRPCDVTLYSDSKYLVETMNGNYQRRTNMALWAMLDIEARRHTINWRWLKGHAGDRWNERADVLANKAVRLNETEGLFS